MELDRLEGGEFESDEISVGSDIDCEAVEEGYNRSIQSQIITQLEHTASYRASSFATPSLL